MKEIKKSKQVVLFIIIGCIYMENQLICLKCSDASAKMVQLLMPLALSHFINATRKSVVWFNIVNKGYNVLMPRSFWINLICVWKRFEIAFFAFLVCVEISGCTSISGVQQCQGTP